LFLNNKKVFTKFPWAVSLGQITSMDFLLELVIGFVYAWNIGALEWE